jgi:hypothetical protein
MKISPISKSSDLRPVQRATECNQFEFHVGGYKITLLLLNPRLTIDLICKKSRRLWVTREEAARNDEFTDLVKLSESFLSTRALPPYLVVEYLKDGIPSHSKCLSWSGGVVSCN